MHDFNGLILTLKDLYAQRDVRRVVYFHCDHWEPWRPTPGVSEINNANGDEVHRFVEACGRHDYAARQTLFYKCPVNFIFDHEPYKTSGVKCDPKDGIRFAARNAAQLAITKQALGHVATGSRMEVQVHLHHENITSNTAHRKPEVIAFMKSPAARQFEEQRFALWLKLTLQAIEDDTGRALSRWFFVHGLWAVNACDPSVCHLTREIAILMDHGCLGDFTLPSGRPIANPRLEVPYFATPVDAPKGYDLQESGPELAYGNSDASSRGKFFLWSSLIKHRGASLDYYAPWLQERLAELASLAREIVTQSYAIDGTLYIKTHAHSMHPNYYIGTDKAVFPHLHPPIRNLFGVLLDAASAAGCKVDFRTASEVYDEFTSATYVPPAGFALTMPGQAPVIGGCLPAERRLKLKTALVQSIESGRNALDALPRVGAPVARPPPTDPLAHLDLVSETAKRAVQELIDDLGIIESGAGNTYAARAAAPSFLMAYERELIQYLVASERYDSYHEIGCGFGAMVAALAAAGLPSVGFESDKRRAAGAQRVHDGVVAALSERNDRLATSCEIVQGRFPTTLKGRDVSRSLAYCTDLTSTNTPEQRADLISAMRSYKSVIIDLQRFVERRTTDEACTRLQAELEASGLGPGRLILDLGSAGRYVRFDRP